MTGPEVVVMFAPIAFATIWASDVLPNPGGPQKSKCSSESSRCFAAPMSTSKPLFNAHLPDKLIQQRRPQRHLNTRVRGRGSKAGLSGIPFIEICRTKDVEHRCGAVVFPQRVWKD